ncbi:ABC transporter permease subunit [Streptococcus equi subsp. equi]|uniref:ABC transporter permease subunit n=1 Tax=Streptococcus equi TaxID=1336 RepID=UPI0022AB6B21|nr:ABC transporter permease subunit [Streptococcus equi]MCD3495262.1 ABC transporter permease subunit [Streptococcus equi subsp. equi]
MLIQVTVITLTGYAYSRYHFFGRQKSLGLFLSGSDGSDNGCCLNSLFLMAWLFNALNHYWFLILIYVGGGIPMNAWLMKGYFDTVPYDLDESAKLDGSGHFRTFYQLYFLWFVLWLLFRPYGPLWGHLVTLCLLSFSLA